MDIIGWTGSILTAAPYTNTTTTAMIVDYGTYSAGFSVPGGSNNVPPNKLSDTPETWLRGRVKEICDLAKA